MATPAQYEYFKYLYDQERDRYKELVKRAQLYLTLVSLYVGAMAFKISGTGPTTGRPTDHREIYAASVIMFLIALLLVIVASGVFPYQHSSNPRRIIERFGDTPPTDDEFMDDRVVDFAVATELNRTQNGYRAALLKWSSVFMFIGAFLHAVYFLVTVL